jgi:hypothetical protein
VSDKTGSWFRLVEASDWGHSIQSHVRDSLLKDMPLLLVHKRHDGLKRPVPYGVKVAARLATDLLLHLATS